MNIMRIADNNIKENLIVSCIAEKGLFTHLIVHPANRDIHFQNHHASIKS